MASTGSSAWTKYFKGQDVSTVMKKDSDAFDTDGTTKLNFKIKANEKILVYDSDSYQSKVVVKRISDNQICRVTFNNIQKPGRETAVNLKPQAFGIGETKYNITDYVDLVLTSIEERTNLSPETKNYLQSLVLYYAGFENLQFTQSAYNAASSSLPMRDIKKDFGEVLGPIAVIKKQILSELSIPSGNTTKIYMPSRPNEPLMDYGIIVGNKTYVVSAKSGTTTNVVKPQDVIDLLKKNSTKLRKYENTEQYKILESLSQNGIVDGAIIAASKLPGGPSPAAAEDVKKKLKTGSYKDDKYDVGLMASFINSNDYLKKQTKPTLNQIMYECEKMIAAKSKNGLNFTPMFKDAVENQVIYIKFDISGSRPDFQVIMNDDFSAKKVTLRTKNGYTRRSDRMGIQV
tara:strand:- start:1656 stop:2861 length:1206 start_codon:yes stop_codon:yes gene_type:complete